LIVPTSTDAIIKQLFGRAMAAKDEAELRRVAKELRAAISEHVHMARPPLAAEPTIIAARDSAGD
jgi:predicted NBD/HSP70 family sugar kinase